MTINLELSPPVLIWALEVLILDILESLLELRFLAALANLWLGNGRAMLFLGGVGLEIAVRRALEPEVLAFAWGWTHSLSAAQARVVWGIITESSFCGGQPSLRIVCLEFFQRGVVSEIEIRPCLALERRNLVLRGGLLNIDSLTEWWDSERKFSLGIKVADVLFLVF